MLIEPGLKAAVLVLQGEEGLGVGDGGLDLEVVADDGGVLHEAGDIVGGEGGDGGDIEGGVGEAESHGFFEDSYPGEAGLVDLEDEALEEEVVGGDGETVVVIVVGGVEWVVGVGKAVVAVRVHRLILHGKWGESYFAENYLLETKRKKKLNHL